MTVAPALESEPRDIVKMRETRNLSRPLFAQILNVSPVTLRKRESGERKLSGAALHLLETMQRLPGLLLPRLRAWAYGLSKS